MWPFRKPERRAQPFTDAVVAALTSQAAGQGIAPASQTAALEAAVSLYTAAFVGATVSPAVPALTPAVRGLLARDLIRRGESLFQIEVDRGRVRLAPIGSWDVRGPPDESRWFYRVDHFGPSGNYTRFVPGASIVHVRFAVDPARPWLGIGPLGWARLAGTLLANAEGRLGEEAGGSVVRVIPMPAAMSGAGDGDKLTALKADLSAAAGRGVFVPTTADGGGGDKAGAPPRDWKQERIGPMPDAGMVSLRSDAAQAVLSACGVPASLVTTGSDGTAQRESWRRFVMGPVESLARLVEHELSAKLRARGAARLLQIVGARLRGAGRRLQGDGRRRDGRGHGRGQGRVDGLMIKFTFSLSRGGRGIARAAKRINRRIARAAVAAVNPGRQGGAHRISRRAGEGARRAARGGAQGRDGAGGVEGQQDTAVHRRLVRAVAARAPGRGDEVRAVQGPAARLRPARATGHQTLEGRQAHRARGRREARAGLLAAGDVGLARTRRRRAEGFAGIAAVEGGAGPDPRGGQKAARARRKQRKAPASHQIDRIPARADPLHEPWRLSSRQRQIGSWLPVALRKRVGGQP